MSEALDALRRKVLEELKKRGLEPETVEFEGPRIVGYVKNMMLAYERPELVKEVARTVRKKVVVRPHSSIRKDPEEAERIIREIVGDEEAIDKIIFDPELGEVIIYSKKPGHVIGKNAQRFKRILAETGWKPTVLRTPPIESRVIDEVRTIFIRKDIAKLRFEELKAIGQRIYRLPMFKKRYVKIYAFGGFREVGRSAILLETKESKILLDVGVNLGSYDPWIHFPRLDLLIEELDAVVVTHAHLDHCGLVPLLYKYGYRGPTFVTRPTLYLMYLILNDYIDVAAKQGALTPYSKSDVQEMLLRTITLNYGEVTDIAPDVKLTFYNAGHILGSAMAHLHIGEGFFNLVYTGDFKYAQTALLNPANTAFPRVEAVLMETTYGSEEQPPREVAERHLLDVIKKTLERGGHVLIPVLAVGRGQEILMTLVRAIESGELKVNGRKPTVYIDGMVKEVNAIHALFPEWLSSSLKEKIMAGEDPFRSDVVSPVDLKEQDRRDVLEGDPSIIIATSGMLTGGPALEYFVHMAEDPKNSLVLVSYQAQGTLGRKLKDGYKAVEVFDPSEQKLIPIDVKLKIFSIEGFSAHSSRSELLRWLSDVRPKPRKVILNHGENGRIESFMRILRNRRALRRLGLPPDLEVLAPQIGESVMLRSE